MQPRVLVMGDGLVGLSAVCALRYQPVSVTWVSPGLSASKPISDQRSIVLNQVSQRVLDRWQVWEACQGRAQPITGVDVSERGRWGKCRFSAKEAHLPALGYVVPANDLIGGLRSASQFGMHTSVSGKVVDLHLDSHSHPGSIEVAIDTGQNTTSWCGDVVIAADGVNSCMRGLLGLEVRQKSYEQVAITCTVDLFHIHGGIAYERFTSEGPLALLPRSGTTYGVVWVVAADRYQSLLDLDDQSFLSALQDCFGTALGLFKGVGERRHYPLSLSWMPQPVGERTVFLGNAAQTLHPVMGQGFNLGLRDVISLVETWEQAGWHGLGQVDVLSHYARGRKADRKRVMRFSDLTVRSFSHGLWPTTWGRSLALSAIDLSKSIKHGIAGLSMGQSTDLPSSACEGEWHG